MIRLLFSLGNGTRTTDDQPVEFPTLAEALAHARAMAAELGSNRDAREIKGLYLRVTDEGGRELYRTPLVNQKRRVMAEDIGRELSLIRARGR